MATVPTSAHWQRALVLLASVFLIALTIGALSWAHAVFIPVALAILITFLLSPAVSFLQWYGLGRALSVVLVVTLACCFVAGIGVVIARQISRLARDLARPSSPAVVAFHTQMAGGVVGTAGGGLLYGLPFLQVEPPATPEQPNYTLNIKRKIVGLRGNASEGSFIDNLEAAFRDIGQALQPSRPAGDQGRVIYVRAEDTSWMSQLPATLVPLLEPLASVGLVLILVSFMLVRRESLRDRLLSLFGHGRMTLTTRALDDASERISRYLMTQLIINSTYGVAFGVGLFLIGVPYSLLWGFLIAVLRYVPYLGVWLALVFPVVISLGMPGWTMPLLVLALFLALELLTNNVAEPLLFGHSIGVSEVALLVAAAFWAWLWGPVGLVLSGPMTVCLVVLGKYVPQLSFFDVLLGDAPTLEPHLRFYQRLVARDQDEAAEIAEAYVQEHPAEQVFDAVLIPALSYARRDRAEDKLSDDDERFIREATTEIAEDLGEPQGLAEPGPSDDGRAGRRVRVIGCAARDDVDHAALLLLYQLLDPGRCLFEIKPAEMLTSELLAAVAEEGPVLVCIASLPPGGVTHTRYLCKRLRKRFPGLKILVGRWGFTGNLEPIRQVLLAAGASQMCTTLLETRTEVYQWLPVLAETTAALGQRGSANRG